MKKRMLSLLLGMLIFGTSAMPAYAQNSNQVQTSVGVSLEGLLPEINVKEPNDVAVTTWDILKNENGYTEEVDDTQEDVTSEEENVVSSGVYDTKIMEAQTLLIESISTVIAESQKEIQRLVEEERKAEDERKRKEEEERKRKEEEERKRKEEEARKKLSAGKKITAYASKFIGNPYVYGGNSLTKGIDCSHFVYQVLKNCGVYDGEYVTSAHWRTKGKAVSSLSQAQAGDIICYDGHVAIYDGNGKLIEALGKKHGICHKRSATSDKILAIRRFV